MAPRSYTRPTNDQRDCPLFKLPPELRNMIYSYAFTRSEPIKPPDSSLPRQYGNIILPVVNVDDVPVVKPSNTLINTCQRIANEASSIFLATQRTFWTSNAFLFELRQNWFEGCTQFEEAELAPPQDLVRLSDEQLAAIPKVLIALNRGDKSHVLPYTEDSLVADPMKDLVWLPEREAFHNPPPPNGLAMARWYRNLVVPLNSAINDTLRIVHVTKRCATSQRSRIAAYEKSVSANMSIPSKDRELSKPERHAVLQWQQQQKKLLAYLEPRAVNMKREVLTSALRHLCDRWFLGRRSRELSRWTVMD